MILTSLTILIFTSGIFGAPARYKDTDIEYRLRDTFSNFVKERTNSVVALSHEAPPRFILISLTLTNSTCSESGNKQSISIGHAQTVVEEETCGTESMQEWCYEFPSSMITFKTRDDKTKTSVLANFKCGNYESGPKIDSDWARLSILGLIVLFILAVIFNFRRLCEEQAKTGKIAEAKQNVIDCSMDTVTLDSSCKEKSRKEIARFDDDSDPSLGTLFTI